MSQSVDLHEIARTAIARLGTSTPCEWTREEYLAIGCHVQWLESELQEEVRERLYVERLLAGSARGV
jgi:hypothetical protein